MRLFIGIRLSEQLKNSLAPLLQETKETLVSVRLVDKANIHLTLKFLGEVEEEKINPLVEILIKAVDKIESFSIGLKGLGFFPDSKRPRVLWVGVEDEGKKLFQIANLLEEKLVKIGLASERGFKEHITIGRFKEKMVGDSLNHLAEKYRDHVWGTMQVSEIELICSLLRPTGPIYTTLKKIPFCG